MTRSEPQPAAAVLAEARRLAGPAAVVVNVVRLEGGQHAATWRVDLDEPQLSVVIRQFPAGDPAACRERRALRALDGLGGLAPVALGGNAARDASASPTSLISWIDGEPDITPDDPDSWARELGRALALAQARAHDRLAALPSALDGTGSRAEMAGPLAGEVHACWSQIAASPEALNHGDYWSGNVLWRDRALVGIVDWSGAARGPAGFDLGWCRLDLVLLFDERLADVFTRAYDSAGGHDVGDVGLWDRWAAARSHEIVDTWAPNYAPLGRADLDAQELRRRHAAWTSHLLERV